MDCLIAIMHEVVVPTLLLYAILITLLLSSFIKPDLTEGRGLVNKIASFVKLHFCIKFPIKLNKSWQIDLTTDLSTPVLIAVLNKSSKTTWNWGEMKLVDK